MHLRTAALAVALLLPFVANAQSPEWHVGLGATSEMTERAPYPFEADAEVGRSFVAGVRFENGFGVESAYVDLGEIVATAVADAGFELEGELWSVGATWGWRLDRIEPYVKLGWFSRDEDGVTISIVGPTPVAISDDGVMAEVGVRWHVADPFALRVGYTHYDFEQDADGAALLLAEWHF